VVEVSHTLHLKRSSKRDSKPVGPEGRILVYQVLADSSTSTSKTVETLKETNLRTLIVAGDKGQWHCRDDANPCHYQLHIRRDHGIKTK